jgi:outer membrane lipoprotein-sorting protein
MPENAMKYLNPSCAMIVLMIVAISMAAQELTGPEIIQKVNDLMNPESSRAEMKMTIQTTSGQLRTFAYESYSKDRGEKSLIKYSEPVRVKDQAILMLNNADDIWVYFPMTGRVRKLATHAKRQKWEGSDFTYEDMGSGNLFVTDFDAELVGEEKVGAFDCYKVDLLRKQGADVAYSRLMMWVDKSTFVPIKIDYYEDSHPGRVQKTLIQSDIKVIDGIPTAMRLVMINQKDHSQTRMEFTKLKYNVPLDDDLFTERGMKK